MHRVADEIFSCSVEEMSEQITYKEFVNWVAYLKLKDERFEKWEFYAAQIAHAVVQVQSKKRYTIADFTIQDQSPTQADPAKILEILAASFGGKIKRLDDG